MRDLFFEKAYGELYEQLENGTCEVYEFTHPLGSVRHIFIKREVPIPHKDGPFYDLITPYGYGGPLIRCKSGREEELIQAFSQAFERFCERKNIVGEFIRFHPIIGNAQDFTGCYDMTYARETVGTNLRDFEDPVQQEFSKSARKQIRKALKAGVTFEVTVNPPDLEQFKEIYWATMTRIGADPYYFFDDAYFAGCLKAFGKDIVLISAVYEGKVIGMELHFRSGGLLHTHLSGTVEEYHHLSPVYVMTYAAVLWGKENGIHLIHAGGGLTNSPEDTLFKFKKKFGQRTGFPFYIGKKIWNPKVYTELCSIAGVSADQPFFPAYRAGRAGAGELEKIS